MLHNHNLFSLETVFFVGGNRVDPLCAIQVSILISLNVRCSFKVKCFALSGSMGGGGGSTVYTFHCLVSALCIVHWVL